METERQIFTIIIERFGKTARRIELTSQMKFWNPDLAQFLFINFF